MLNSDNEKTTDPTLIHVAVVGLASLLLLASPVAVGITAGAQQPAPPLGPMIRENATQKVAAHTWVIPDFDTVGVPNVGIILGSRATLVIDTGMGPRNGEIVLRETRASQGGAVQEGRHLVRWRLRARSRRRACSDDGGRTV